MAINPQTLTNSSGNRVNRRKRKRIRTQEKRLKEILRREHHVKVQLADFILQPNGFRDPRENRLEAQLRNIERVKTRAEARLIKSLGRDKDRVTGYRLPSE